MVAPVPCATQQSEWLKILASTVTGLVAGMLASFLNESLKSRVSRIVAFNRLQRALTQDTLLLYMAMVSTDHGLVPLEKFWAGLGLPAFEYYWAKDMELFYGDFDVRTRVLSYQLILELKRQVTAGNITISEAHPKLAATLSELLKPQGSTNWPRRVLKRLLR